MSANLWHDWPRHRDLPDRLQSLASLIEEQAAQVVLLQEAVRIPGFSASEWLGERLGMNQGYVRANGSQDAIGFEEGLAILTRLPLHDYRAIKLETSAGSLVRRMALGAALEVDSQRIWFFSAHLGFLRTGNRRQMTRLHSWVSELSGDSPAVIGGDFNSSETSQSIRLAREHWQDTFREIHPETDGHTHHLRGPGGIILRRQRLDYLFLKPGKVPWAVLDAGHLSTRKMPHSDHKVVMTRLQSISSKHTYPKVEQRRLTA